MFISDMTNLFIAHNEREDFNLAIVANDSNEALELAKDYGEDTGLHNDWEIGDFDVATKLDCDYIITPLSM